MKLFDWNPETLLRTSGGYWLSCTLHAAVELNIFTLLGDENLTGEEVADRAEADIRGMSVLLNALTAMNLLKKSDTRFANTPESRKYLSKDSEHNTWAI